MRVGVKTNDKYLRQKIRLMLSEDEFCEDGGLVADILLTDTDTLTNFPGRVIKMSRDTDCELKIPFTENELRRAISGSISSTSLLSLADNRCAVLHGEKIALTELEFSLLSALVKAEGEFICRESLLSVVWGEGVSDGILNVYIHYLRDKLEKNGEKIIISSRKYGYKVSERYIKKC